MLKKHLNCFLYLLVVAFFFSCSDTDDIIVEEEIEKKSGLITLYVGANPNGLADGSSDNNAADFLDESFWSSIHRKLANDSVEVIFTPGIYSRAYTEKSFTLSGLGYDNENILFLTGGQDVVFPALEGHPQKSVIFDIVGCQNLVMSDFHFTGNGLVGYVHRIQTTNNSKSNNNITIQNCTWKNMRGIVYGATGAHNRSYPANNTTNITYKNCVFINIGIDSHSHHMYHAHNSSKIKIANCYFEDCTGDYVRFRDNNDYILIENCTFKHNTGFDTRQSPFIAIPLFNSRPPVGDEYFATNYSFSNNEFISEQGVRTTFAIYFGHWGFSPPEYNYLITSDEGQVLLNGTDDAKKKLITDNFGIETDKIRVSGNIFTGNIVNKLSLRTHSSYGSVGLGWEGAVDIFNLANHDDTPFEWETDINSFELKTN